MKRWTLRIVSCLVLGCVTTVAVAWGLVALGTRFSIDVAHFGYVETRDAFDRQFGASDWVGFSYGDVFSSRWRWLGVVINWRFIHPNSGFPAAGPFMSGTLQDVRTGLPLHALGYTEGSLYREGREEIFLSGSYISVNERLGTGRLPLHPIWPGFLIDALFYGVIWFGIYFGFGSARRALRKRRGRCPKCAYQLRDQFDAGCSECGWNRAEDDA